MSDFLKKRSDVVAQAKAIRSAAEEAKRDLTGEELDSIKSLMDSADGFKAQHETFESKKAVLSRLDDGVESIAKVNPVRSAQTGRIESVKEAVLDDPKKGFKSQREFLMSVMDAGRSGRTSDSRLRLLSTAGSDEQGGYADNVGGFLIPEAFSPNLLSIENETDPTAGRTTIIPMASPTIKIPARADKNHTASVTGGLRFYRRAETQEVSSSRMLFEQVVLNANSLMGLAYVTEELIQDSAISIVALLQTAFNDEYRAHMLNEKLRGTGVGEYLGILNAPSLVTVAKESGQSADTINYTNVVKMRSRAYGYANSVWIANHDTYPQLSAMSNGSLIVYQNSISEARPDTLLGRPIFYSEFASTLGDVGDIILADWSQYLEGMYQPLQSAESLHVRFVNHERAFKFFGRSDGRPWWSAALTPKKSALTLSPFVTLEAR